MTDNTRDLTEEEIQYIRSVAPDRATANSALRWLYQSPVDRAAFRGEMNIAMAEEAALGESRELARFLTTCALSNPLNENEYDDIKCNYHLSLDVANAAIHGLNKDTPGRVFFRKLKDRDDKQSFLSVTAQGK
jgi:hypothetical protein